MKENLKPSLHLNMEDIYTGKHTMCSVCTSHTHTHTHTHTHLVWAVSQATHTPPIIQPTGGGTSASKASHIVVNIFLI